MDIETGESGHCASDARHADSPPSTGAALFTWKSLDHIQPSECYVTAGETGGEGQEPWDYFHLNSYVSSALLRGLCGAYMRLCCSIEKDLRGNFLISSRHCKAVYYVDGSNGNVLWRLGGMNSSFTMGEGTDFQFQHDARWRGSNDSAVS